MTRANGNRVVSFFACLLGLGLPSASVTGQVNGAIASPQENSAKPVRMRVSQNAPRATTQRPPVYPATAAIDQRIEGKVVLHVIIGGDGTVKEVYRTLGYPLLTQSAMEAVKQWQYRPMSLNGNPVEMDTTVTLDYALGPPPTVMVNNQPLPAFSPEGDHVSSAAATVATCGRCCHGNGYSPPNRGDRHEECCDRILRFTPTWDPGTTSQRSYPLMWTAKRWRIVSRKSYRNASGRAKC